MVFSLQPMVWTLILFAPYVQPANSLIPHFAPLDPEPGPCLRTEPLVENVSIDQGTDREADQPDNGDEHLDVVGGLRAALKPDEQPDVEREEQGVDQYNEGAV